MPLRGHNEDDVRAVPRLVAVAALQNGWKFALDNLDLSVSFHVSLPTLAYHLELSLGDTVTDNYDELGRLMLQAELFELRQRLSDMTRQTILVELLAVRWLEEVVTDKSIWVGSRVRTYLQRPIRP